MVDAQRKLIGVGDDLRSRGVGALAVWPRRGNLAGDTAPALAAISGLTGIRSVSVQLRQELYAQRIDACALGRGRHRHHLRGSQHLPESLVLREVESALAAVVNMRNVDRAAIRESELVAPEGRNAPGIRGRGMVEIVARVKGGVAHELKKRAVEAARPRAGDDVGDSPPRRAPLPPASSRNSTGSPPPHRH